MAPEIDNGMSQEQLVEEHGKRLNVHAERLNTHEKLLGDHQKILGEYGLSLFGDAKLNVKGLVESVEEMSDSLREILAWRSELTHYYRAGRFAVRLLLILAGTGVLGIWWPQLAKLADLIGG